MANDPNRILDAAFLKKLERLSIISRRPFAGQMKGEKKSLKRGTSIEFADYREYGLGDDLRYVDWNLAARFDKMFLKLFVEEEDLFLSLLIDTSESMRFGEPAKFRFAVQLAAALGYIGLSNYDRVSVQPYTSELGRALPTQRGKGGVLPFFSFLETLKVGGNTSFSSSLKRYASTVKHKGVAIVFSDFFDSSWQEGVKALLARGFQVSLIQTLSEDEIKPSLLGDLRIIDSETGEFKEMSVNPQLQQRYELAFLQFCGEIESFSHRYGVDYLRASSSMPVEQIVLQHLRAGGQVK